MGIEQHVTLPWEEDKDDLISKEQHIKDLGLPADASWEDIQNEMRKKAGLPSQTEIKEQRFGKKNDKEAA